MLGAHRAVADRGKELGNIGFAERAESAFEDRVGSILAGRFEGAFENLSAETAELGLLGGADRTADRRTRLARRDERLPCRRGPLHLRADDLDFVAVFEPRAQRHVTAIDLATDAGVADLRVYGIGEIDRRRAARQCDEHAVGREAENLVGKHLELGVLHELFGRAAMLEHFDQLPKPTERRREFARRFAVHGPFLVEPMSGNAVLGDLMHLARPNLNLRTLLLWPDHRCMDRTITVVLRRRDVVLEPARNHRP